MPLLAFPPNAGPFVNHAHRDPLARSTCRAITLSFHGQRDQGVPAVFQGIGNEVVQDLTHAPDVGLDEKFIGRADLQRESSLARLRAEVLGGFADDGADVRSHSIERDLPGLSLGYLEQVLDHGQRTLNGATNVLDSVQLPLHELTQDSILEELGIAVGRPERILHVVRKTAHQSSATLGHALEFLSPLLRLLENVPSTKDD